jgi:hypothetical protein
MLWRFWIALCGILIAIGFAVGFATSQFLQAQTATATIPELIVSIAPIAGAGVASLGLFQAWNRSRKEDERIPVLQFEGFFFIRNMTLPLSAWIGTIYLVRVRRTNPEIGRAEQCEGFVSLADTAYNNMRSRWMPDSVVQSDIGGHMDLLLFQITNVGRVMFSPTTQEGQPALVDLDPETNLDRLLTIEVHGTNTKNPEPLRKTLREIVAEARALS